MHLTTPTTSNREYFNNYDTSLYPHRWQGKIGGILACKVEIKEDKATFASIDSELRVASDHADSLSLTMKRLCSKYVCKIKLYQVSSN